MKAGADVSDTDLDTRIASQKPGHCCSLIYTSGTTGNPKAVMISNDNATWTAGAMLNSLGIVWGDKPEHAVSFLPLSHIAAQILDLYGPLWVGANKASPWTVWIARNDALKGTLGLTLKAARPTFFFGVPRVWEKFCAKLQMALGAKEPTGKHMVGWARAAASRYGNNMQVGGTRDVPWEYPIAEGAVLAKIKVMLGFDRCKVYFTGAAPTDRQTLDFFYSIGIPLYEVYGMSEVSGPATLARVYHYKIGSCGPRMEGAETVIRPRVEDDAAPADDPKATPSDEKEDEKDPDEQQQEEMRDSGEICMRGRNNMMGYMYDEEKTKKTIDEQGWVHSGDLGKFVDGCLFITGRIKELIITKGGENIAPVPIEEKIKELCPGISNAMAIGDERKYVTLLVTLKTVQGKDEKGVPVETPTDILAPAAQQMGDSKTVGEAQKDEKLKAAIQNAVDTYNKVARSRAQKIQYFRILPTDFSRAPAEGKAELGPTLKLKRSVVVKKYKSTIDEMYKG